MKGGVDIRLVIKTLFSFEDVAGLQFFHHSLSIFRSCLVVVSHYFTLRE